MCLRILKKYVKAREMEILVSPFGSSSSRVVELSVEAFGSFWEFDSPFDPLAMDLAEKRTN